MIDKSAILTHFIGHHNVSEHLYIPAIIVLNGTFVAAVISFCMLSLGIH
jgi:hypothetical protein